MKKTIYALATAKGSSGVAIIRISGPQAIESLKYLCPSLAAQPRIAHFTPVVHDGDHIDDAVVLYFPSPNSFTGENVVEFHLHGSPAIIKDMFSALSKLPNYRMAEPGEFSRRAFENKKFDLTAIEGIADLVRAETTEQRKQALRQLNGAQGRLYDAWRAKLINILSVCEAEIDFVEEELPDDLIQRTLPQLRLLQEEIAAYLNDKCFGERIREGFRVAIIGAPNVGKSSLLNCLAKRDVAIVSHLKGTTRDIIELEMDIQGYPIIIADTAGIRESTDIIEIEGIKRAEKWSEQADLVIHMHDIQNYDPDTLFTNDSTINVVNKSDLSTNHSILGVHVISVAQQQGINDLIGIIHGRIEEMKSSASSALITNERHRYHITECVSYLTAALSNTAPEFVVEDIRLAMRELGKITGRVDVEDLLDNIFANFCIGK
jgi:tRNA modification GTPase